MSLSRVGTESGYSRGIVNHQFGSKDELLRRAARYAQSAVPSPAPDLRGLERLVALVDNYIAYILKLETPGRAFLMMWAEAVAAEPVLQEMYIERDAWFRRLIAEVVAEGIADHSIRSDVSPAALAILILGQLRGVGLQLMLAPEPDQTDFIRRTATEILTLGLTPPTPRNNGSVRFFV
jgi:AcrR family transcriptional regulator